MKAIRPWVFWPTFFVLFLALALSFLNGPLIVKALEATNSLLLGALSPLFSVGALALLLTCLMVFVSPLGRVSIGGKGARRELSPVSWCTVSLCTTTAVGFLFWSMAEPILHLSQPPASLLLEAGSTDAARFALSTMYLHWTLVPCAIYTVPALMFALAFYNLGLPFSLSSCLAPLLGRSISSTLSDWIDGVCLFALVVGMSASLATGVLTMAGGLEHQLGIVSGPTSWNLIGLVIVCAFIASALSGLDRGVRWLSNLNTVFFLVLAVSVAAWVPWGPLLNLAGPATADHATHFVRQALFLDFDATDPWPKAWTVFYWAVWLAWAPVTAVFLGRIGRGYTVRQFLMVNLLLPAAFSYLWMSLFSGAALWLQLSGGVDMVGLLSQRGPEGLVYAVLGQLPLGAFLIPLFLLTAFISYVTAADSNTMAMAGMSSHGVSPDCIEPSMWIKILWGAMVGLIALSVLSMSGIAGIKALSYLGGFSGLFFALGAMASVWRLAWNPSTFGLTSAKIPTTSPTKQPKSLFRGPQKDCL